MLILDGEIFGEKHPKYNDWKVVYQNFKREKNLETGRAQYPMVFKWMPHLYRKDPMNKGKFIQPRAWTLQPVVTVKTSNGSAEWRYATSYVKYPDGVVEAAPTNIEFAGNLTLSHSDWELAFYLKHICPRSNNSPYKGANAGYEVLDLQDKAEKEIEVEKKLSRAKNIILNYLDYGMTDESFRDFAKALHISGTDGLEIAQIQQIIIGKIVKNDKYGHSESFKYCDRIFKFKNFDDIEVERIKLHSLIQNVRDKGLIIHRDKTWVLVADGEQEKIVNTAYNANGFIEDYLASFLIENPDYRERLESLLEEKEIPTNDESNDFDIEQQLKEIAQKRHSKKALTVEEKVLYEDHKAKVDEFVALLKNKKQD